MCLCGQASRRGLPVRCVLVSAALLALSDLSCRVHAQHDLAKDDDEDTPPQVEQTTTAAPAKPEKVAETKTEKPPPKPQPTEQPQAQKQSSAPAPVRAPRIPQGPPPPDNYYLEKVAGAILLIYLVTFIRGKTANSGIAQAFERDCLEVYKQNFHQVGENDDQNFVQEGYSNYRLYTSGRMHCNFCLTSLDLAKRQDPCTAYILSNFQPWEDIARLEIPIDSVDNYNFCLYRKGSQKGTSQSDLTAFGRVRKVEELPAKDFAVMSDCGEVVGTILSQSVLQTIKKYEKCVSKIRISDSMQGSAHVKKGIIAEFRLPGNPNDMDQMTNLVRMTMHLVDCVAQLKLSEKTRAAMQEARREAQKTSEADVRLQREQRMQQKKIEKQKAAEKEWENLTPEQQRKKEDQAYKKQLKNRMPKMKMMK